MPWVPTRPLIKTRSAVDLPPNNGNMVMSPSFLAYIVDMTWALVAASVIMQNVPIGRVRAMQRDTHFTKSALWCAL